MRLLLVALLLLIGSPAALYAQGSGDFQPVRPSQAGDDDEEAVEDEEAAEEAPSRRPVPRRVPRTSDTDASPSGGTAQFVVVKPLVENAAYKDLAEQLHGSDMLQTIAQNLNSKFRLPRKVEMRFAECGEANAYYDPNTRQISVCIELMEIMAEQLAEEVETDEELQETLTGAATFITLHEAGHALVDVLEVPVTGREEDAVDQLSAWMLIDGDEEGYIAVLSAAQVFYSDAELDDSDFADEHSLDQQRYFNMVCWVYGSDPENSDFLLEDWELPTERAERCEGEFTQLKTSWNRLLSNHRRTSRAAAR